MRDKILAKAQEIFGESRFEELSGQLWLERDVIKARWDAALVRILQEWASRFRRDVEEGRHRAGAGSGGGRRRVARFSELEIDPDRLHFYRRKF
jgi:hypothetical protein